MKRSYIGLALGALVAVGAVLSLPSCGHDQKLLSITVQPSSYTFLQNVDQQTANFRAYGNYIHPPAQKEITSQVTWNTDVPGVITVTSGAAPTGGMVTTHGNCGLSDVSATAPEGTGGSSNIIVGYGSVTVNDPNNPACPGGSKQQAVVAVVLAGTAAGIVTSVPAGATCPGPCGAQFPVGSLVVLNAAPNSGSKFVGWDGCTPGNPPTTCTLNVPLNGVLVTATFN